jgi:alginate O-acetyltransferase complex protein AlgI
MLFNSYSFIFIYLPLVLVGFFALRRQNLRLAFVVVASYVFYAFEAWWFPALMLASTAISFTAALAVAASDGRTRKLVLAGGIAGVLSLLAFFKYAGLSYSFLTVITAPGFPAVGDFVEGIVLPAGISFYTFEAISYMVDVHRGTVPPERNPLRYAYFISFFPHLIAGPIVRYGKLGPQLGRLYRIDPDLLRSGVLLFSVGLAKKVLIADGIAVRIDPVLADPSRLGFLDAWLAMVGYAFQIYFDFSAYSDMALGIARMFGIELPWNFDRPYRAASPSEFWRRWHVTLSSWLRDYLYIPLGGSRKGPRRRDANLLATMGLGGLWHGASLTFVAWGLWHGLLLVANHRLKRLPFRLSRPAAIVLTFLVVTIGWVFFRMTSLDDIGHVLAAMGGLRGLGVPLISLVPYLAVAAALMWGAPEEWRWRFQTWGPRRLAPAAALTALALIYVNATQKFLYFQF